MGGAFESSQARHAANTVVNLVERRMRRERLLSGPLTVQVEVTTRCNLNCMICSRWCAPFRGRDLDPALIKPVLDLSRRSRELVLFGYGEPLIADAFYELLERAMTARVSFVTNGLVLDPPLAEQIISTSQRPIRSIAFSIDAATADTYRSVREHSDFDRVWDNLANLGLLTRGHRPELWIEFVAMKRNIAELPALVEKAASAGVSRVNVFNVVVWDRAYANESLIHCPSEAREVFARAKETALGAGVHLDLPVVPAGPTTSPDVPVMCVDPWSFAYIRQDGTVHPCCFSESAMGNLFEDSFERIWNNKAYQSLRRSVNTADAPEPCRTCEQRWRTANSEDDAAIYLRLKPKMGAGKSV